MKMNHFSIFSSLLKTRWFSVYRLFPAFALLGLTGCASLNHIQENVEDVGTSYKPSNIYCRAPVIPSDIRRVALLPVSTTTDEAFLQTGAETLEPIVYAELVKTKKFEIVPVTRQQMKEWTGRTLWKTDEALPPDFFKKIGKATACDAVMFAQLTRFQPYQPIAVGWKLNLIQTATTVVTDPLNATNAADPITNVRSSTFWSVDEVLDSGDPSVSLASRRYYRAHLRNDAPAADVSTMASSPTRFGQYALYSLLATLPSGQNGRR